MLRGLRYNVLPIAALCSSRCMYTDSKENTTDGKKEDNARFIHATVVFRHGARTTVFTELPGLEHMNWDICSKSANDALPPVDVKHMNGGERPDLSSSVARQVAYKLKGNCFAGQLSDLGINQTEALGKTIKSLYGSYIGDDVSKITVRTTNVPRCVASAQGVLKGLFPHNKHTVPIFTLHTKEEYATPNTGACPRLAELWKAASATWHKNPGGDGVHTMNEVREVIHSSQLGAYKLNEGNFIPLRDLMVALDAHDLPIPKSIEKLTPLLSRLDRLGGLQIGALLKGGGGWANEVESSRLAIGKLLGEIIERLNKKAKEGQHLHPSLYLVSAHDTTLVPLLVALGVYDGDWPPYASYISFELWEDMSSGNASPNNYMVRVLFNGEPLPLPRCDVDRHGRAPLASVVRGLKPVITKDVHHECNRVKTSRPVVKHEAGGDKF